MHGVLFYADLKKHGVLLMQFKRVEINFGRHLFAV